LAQDGSKCMPSRDLAAARHAYQLGLPTPYQPHFVRHAYRHPIHTIHEGRQDETPAAVPPPRAHQGEAQAALRSRREQEAEARALAAELSRRAHAPGGVAFDLIGNPIPSNLPASAIEDHNGMSNDYVRNLVCGGLHGCITSFGIISASRGAGFDASATLIVCVANILANAIAIGLGEYISKNAEREVAGEEYKREMWEMQNYPEGEVLEMVQIYQERYGFSHQDAKTVIETMSRYEKFFVDHMMQVELGMQTPAEINGIWKNALATVFSVTAFGIMPLVAYLSLYVVNPNPAFMLPLMLAATVFATCFILFTLGFTNAVLTRQPRLRSGLRMVLHAGVVLCMAVVAAYSAGRTLSSSLEGAFEPHM